MTTATLDPPVHAPGGTASRHGRLALALQEAFTVAVRLRANRQVAADTESFRAQIKNLLAIADRDARAAGYAPESVKLAIYAFIAFLDESVLNSTQPIFAEWPRRPLQEEVFGDHTAGETFFRHLEGLLARQDAEELADLLEVFQLCLLLGFRGRYAASRGPEIDSLVSAVRDKILRIRGELPPLSPAWAPPAGAIRAAGDPWIPRLGIVAAATVAAALVAFAVFRLLLRSGVAEVQAIGLPLLP